MAKRPKTERAPRITEAYLFTRESTYESMPKWVRRIATHIQPPFALPSERAQRLPFLVSLPDPKRKPGSKMNITYPVHVGDTVERRGRTITYRHATYEEIKAMPVHTKHPDLITVTSTSKIDTSPPKKPEPPMTEVPRITPLADRASDELWSVLRWFAGVNESGRTMMTMPEMNVLDIALRAVHTRVQDVARQIRQRESEADARALGEFVESTTRSAIEKMSDQLDRDVFASMVPKVRAQVVDKDSLKQYGSVIPGRDTETRRRP